MSYRIKIQDIRDIFLAAHEKVVVEHRKTGQIILTPIQTVKKLWKELYNVDVIYDNSRAIYLDFEDERHYIMFVLSVKS